MIEAFNEFGRGEQKGLTTCDEPLCLLVGVRGFEPPTPSGNHRVGVSPLEHCILPESRLPGFLPDKRADA